MNAYSETCNEVLNVLLAMEDDDLVHLMRSIDERTSKFDGLFTPIEIGDLISDQYRDVEDVADACLAIGATDYSDLVRYNINGGWESGKDEDMIEDAKFWADDAAEWLLDQPEDDIPLLWWTDEMAMHEVIRISNEYWDTVLDETA